MKKYYLALFIALATTATTFAQCGMVGGDVYMNEPGYMRDHPSYGGGYYREDRFGPAYRDVRVRDIREDRFGPAYGDVRVRDIDIERRVDVDRNVRVSDADKSLRVKSAADTRTPPSEDRSSRY